MSKHHGLLVMVFWCIGICRMREAYGECVALCDAHSSDVLTCHTIMRGPTLADVANHCWTQCFGALSQASSECFSSSPTDLIRTVAFRGGCVTSFTHGIYFSPDCKNLRGSGNTVNIYNNDYSHIRGMVTYKNCIITAFDDGTIHKSCGEKLNLAADQLVYSGGILLYAFYVRSNEVCASFVEDHGCYCDPDGESFVGGRPGDHHC
jgi:hypothetical protein